MNALEIHPEAVVDESVRFYPSVRGTRIVVGARTHIDAFAVIRAVGGTGDVIIDEDSRIGPHCVLYSSPRRSSDPAFTRRRSTSRRLRTAVTKSRKSCFVCTA